MRFCLLLYFTLNSDETAVQRGMWCTELLPSRSCVCFILLGAPYGRSFPLLWAVAHWKLCSSWNLAFNYPDPVKKKKEKKNCNNPIFIFFYLDTQNLMPVFTESRLQQTFVFHVTCRGAWRVVVSNLSSRGGFNRHIKHGLTRKKRKKVMEGKQNKQLTAQWFKTMVDCYGRGLVC